MNRLESRFEALADAGEKALGIFLTAGYPTPKATAEMLPLLDAAGVDFIELGMPFSDPLAEGLTIQKTSSVALENGVDLENIFSMVAEFRQTCNTPLLLMGYINPIYRYGVSNFCERAASVGVDGLIIADLPSHESDFLREEADQHGLDVVHLVTPNTSAERIEFADNVTSGFLYAVSLIGLTGADLKHSVEIENYLTRLQRTATRNRIMAGFGIRSREDANALARFADGVIVGSAFLKDVAAGWSEFGSPEIKAEAVKEFVSRVRPTVGTTKTIQR